MTSSPYSMGCIPSRSSVAPSDSRPESNTQLVSDKDINYPSENNSKKGVNIIAAVSDPTSVGERMSSLNPENQQAGSDEDMMSILMSERKEDISAGLIQRGDTIKARHKDKRQGTQSNYSSVASITRTLGRGDSEQSVIVRPGDLAAKKNNPRSSSFDDETDLNLLRQYIAVDYEIAQLEDRDALRMYHEKIEQLEQLERELDMISSEAEEVAAARGGSGMNKIPESSRASVDGGAGGQAGAGKTAICSIPIAESGNNSVISAESMSRSSWADAGKSEKLAQTQTNGGSNHANKEIDQRQHNRSEASNQEVKVTTDELNHASASPIAAPTQRVRQGKSPTSRHSSQRSKNTTNEGQVTNLSMSSLARYPTIEEVFNRKIILERERDKLKKEVEHVIVECDKLQSRYKRRDEILDKLFDGKKGNGLENHLEQQLNWLLEQKHYVDQVFYAWKRAETLTSQTCEQFASASEILKRLSNDNSDTSASQRNILVQSVTELLVKSRLDMDQAQKYNPNVDAPFFTDNETERFDKVIATLKSSQVESLTQNDFSQMMTVIQFAHKRAVSIRLWLEQILQTTIARDSFELAEEYKWIAIQLRKERINLIRHRLQESPYRSMARSIQEQMAQRQLTASHQRRAHEQQLNRDSGVESEPNDIDFEEEIYRLMVYLYPAKLDKGRFSQQAHYVHDELSLSQVHLDCIEAEESLLIGYRQIKVSHSISSNQTIFYQASSGKALPDSTGLDQNATGGSRAELGAKLVGKDGADLSSGDKHSSFVASQLESANRLKVELDEEAKRNLLKQLDQIHNKHRGRIETIRDSNKARATDLVSNKMRQVRQGAQKHEQLVDLVTANLYN